MVQLEPRAKAVRLRFGDLVHAPRAHGASATEVEDGGRDIRRGLPSGAAGQRGAGAADSLLAIAAPAYCLRWVSWWR